MELHSFVFIKISRLVTLILILTNIYAKKVKNISFVSAFIYCIYFTYFTVTAFTAFWSLKHTIHCNIYYRVSVAVQLLSLCLSLF